MWGTFHIIAGIAGIWNGDFYVATENYIFTFSAVTWGWIHLIVGIVVLLAGFGLFSGSVWARTIAVILAGLSAIANFMWLPHYPVWSLVVIAFDIAVIWALTTHGRDITYD